MWDALIRDPAKKPVAASKVPSLRVVTHVMDRTPPKPIVPKTPAPPKAAPEAPDGNPWKLSPQQLKVLAALSLSRGATRAQVAESIGITEKTMDVHLSRMRERMGVTTTQAAIHHWLRLNVFPYMEERRAAAEASLIAKLRRP